MKLSKTGLCLSFCLVLAGAAPAWAQCCAGDQDKKAAAQQVALTKDGAKQCADAGAKQVALTEQCADKTAKADGCCAGEKGAQQVAMTAQGAKQCADATAAASGCCAGKGASAMTVVALSTGPVNAVCPGTGEPVNAKSHTVAYKGRTVGFCCPGCEGKWTKKADADKDAFLARFVAVNAETGTLNARCPISGEPIDGTAIKVAHKDDTLGFCCKGCVKKWNAMDEAKRDGTVARIIAAKAAGTEVAAGPGVHTILTGMLIDLPCYLRGEKPGTSDADIACAEKCIIEHNMPAGLLVEREPNGVKTSRLYVLLNTSGLSSADLYKGHFGKQVSLCGDAFDQNGLSALMVQHHADCEGDQGDPAAPTGKTAGAVKTH